MNRRWARNSFRRLLTMFAPILILFMLILSSSPVSAQPWLQLGGRSYLGDATWNNSNYWISATNQGGWFANGQNADIVLNGYGFDNSNSSLSFRHPAGIASDGTHLVVADSSNNRILIWNSPPTGNIPPDLVLGQKNFTTNLSGNGTGEMNWPLSVSAAGGRLAVADTDNNRILLWNQFPTSDDQAPDIVIHCCKWYPLDNTPGLNWPNAVWTNGTMLIVTATLGGTIFIWNHFPTTKDQPPDMYLFSGTQSYAPRSIVSNGTYLIVAVEGVGSWVWDKFPTISDTPYNFVLTAPSGDQAQLWGTPLPDGRLATIAKNGYLAIWDAPPENSTSAPNLSVGQGCDFAYNGLYRFCVGSPPGGVAYAAGRLYVALYDGEKLVVFNSIPTSNTSVPDFAIGAPSVYQDVEGPLNVWENPMVVTDGQSLFVGGGLNEANLYVWKNLPDQSGANANLFYDNPSCTPSASSWCYYQTQTFKPRAGVAYGGIVAFAGVQKVWIWEHSPVLGQNPDIILGNTGSGGTSSSNLGNVTLNDVEGIALDSSHFYLADRGANKIYVWNGIPTPGTSPAITLNVSAPGQMSSDGTHLVVSLGYADEVAIYNVSPLNSTSQPTIVSLSNFQNILQFNGVQGVCACGGHLFVADGGNNRVLGWSNIQNAVAGNAPDLVLGQPNFESNGYGNGPNQLFIPAYLAWDGSHLWVGETKFGAWLVRYSSSAISGDQSFSLSVDGNQFPLQANTGDTVSSMAFNPALKMIRFTVAANSSGAVSLVFPNRLLNGSLAVQVDGVSTTAQISSFNSTYTTAKVTYSAGKHLVYITGADSVTTKSASDLAISVSNPGIIAATGSSPFNSATLAISSPLNITALLNPNLSTGNLTLEYRQGPLNPDYAATFGAWVKIVSSEPTNGVLSASWTPPTSGAYVFQATWTGNSSYDASRSSTYILEVESGPISSTSSVTSTLILPTSTGTSSYSTSTVQVTSSSTVTSSSIVASQSSLSSISARTSSSQTSSSSTIGSSGGRGIPEFPYQMIAVTVFTILVVASYVIFTRRLRPAGSSYPRA